MPSVLLRAMTGAPAWLRGITLMHPLRASASSIASQLVTRSRPSSEYQNGLSWCQRTAIPSSRGFTNSDDMTTMMLSPMIASTASNTAGLRLSSSQ